MQAGQHGLAHEQSLNSQGGTWEQEYNRSSVNLQHQEHTHTQSGVVSANCCPPGFTRMFATWLPRSITACCELEGEVSHVVFPVAIATE